MKRYLRLIKKLLTPKGSVFGQAVTSGVWGMIINVSDRLLRIVMLIALTHLLPPEEFGLMGIALVTLAAMKTLSKLGINKALIQQEESNVDDYLDTTWTMQVGRGLFLALVAFLLAPYIAAFFGEPRVTDLVRVIGLGPLIEGLRNPGVVYFQKNLDFHKRFVYKMTGAVANLTFAVGFALVVQNVWALVVGLLADRTIKLIVSYAIQDYRPRPGYDPEVAREILNFGKWIMGSSVVFFITLQGDDAFVGWLLGAGALGLYQMAYRLSNAPATEITQVISSVAFPAYSKVQNDDRKLREGYFKTLQLTALMTIPTTVGIIVVTPLFVRTFLGEEWVPMVLAMQILAAHGGLRALAGTFGPLFEAIGRPDYNTKVGVVSAVGLTIVIYPLTSRFGIEGTAVAILLMSMFFPIPLYLTLRSIDGSLSRFLRAVSYPAFGSAVMGLGVYLLGQLQLGYPIIKFVLLVASGAVIYAAVMILVDRRFGCGIEDLFREIIQGI